MAQLSLFRKTCGWIVLLDSTVGFKVWSFGLL